MERCSVNKALREVGELGKQVTGKMFLVKESSCAKALPWPRGGGLQESQAGVTGVTERWGRAVTRKISPLFLSETTRH